MDKTLDLFAFADAKDAELSSHPPGGSRTGSLQYAGI